MNLLRKLKTTYAIAREAPKGWPSYVWNTGMAQLGRTWPLLPPVHIALEPTNVCNAGCPVCETGRREMSRPAGMLGWKDFTRFMDRAARTTNSMLLYFMGETFLNKRAYDMIRYARKKNIYVETCTNGDFVDAKGIIYSDINKISYQIGGMTEETHHRYRVNSSLKRVKKNLIELIEERKKHPKSNVQIEAGFIVMRHNEHEVDEFIKWSREIGVDLVNVIDPCVRNMLEGYAYLPRNRKYWYYDEKAFERGVLKPKVMPQNQCLWIWNSIQINWDGTAVPCCRDPLGQYIIGNVFEQGLWRVFNTKPARDFRRRILTNQHSMEICRLCSGYGLPEMDRKKPACFEIRRHTFNAEDIKSPSANP
jgi:MoaA/NifB/PqqE/SkfB family radical SAM enzyme